MSAAHCVRSDQTGAYFSNFIYQAQYFRGNASRQAQADCISTFGGFVSNDPTHFKWDVALLRVPGFGDFGYFGTHFGSWGQYNAATSIGYPLALENGEVIQVNQGALFNPGWDGIVGLNHGNPLHTGGASGGAWVALFNSSSMQGNYVIGVNSFGIPGSDGIMFGPYWTDPLFNTLLNSVLGCR
jgi:hypothetical protein